MNLEEKYRKETGYSSMIIIEQGNGIATYRGSYVEWLEQQIKDLSLSNIKKWFTIDDRKNMQPVDRDYLIKFDNGEIIKHSQSNWPMAIVTHWAEL